MTLSLIRTVIGTAGALMLSCTVATPAYAAHESSLVDPDNVTQCVKSPSITSTTVAIRDHGMAQLSRSDINTSFCTGDDIWVRDSYLGDSYFFGITQCYRRTLSGNRCDIYIIEFNESRYDNLTATEEASLGCHEFGHTGSIGHRTSSTDTDNNSCMRQDI